MEKRMEDLNLEDDFLFSRVMCDEEICRCVLEKILNISIRKIVLPEQQKTIDLLPDSKGVRLDIYVNDDIGTIYNCEMQRGITRVILIWTLFQKANPIPACAEATLFLSVPLTLLQKAGISTPFRTPVSKAPGFSWEMRQRNCF